MSHRVLPEKAKSEEFVSIGGTVDIDTRKGNLSLTEPKLSYKEFHDLMGIFLKTASIVRYRMRKVEDEFATIFSPITTALKKANLSKDEIDYVLFIGGSSKNPYVQAKLKDYFNFKKKK